MFRLKAELILNLLMGCLETLMLARLALQLFAARPSNAGVAALIALSTPLVAPLSALDAGQPRFGSILEFSTLVWCLGLPIAYSFAHGVFRKRG